ncbi:hypothetical protein P378_13800 [Desulforamulus profundi]|uniref:Uncharacterized protein n=1 Tax=Desulforamulus profundi TaxID=1383067 RepID=A0A2C6MDX2_9FIRM|nr:hypothetical protein [Desulforamulus profundi]PHJ37795.1 hypothetical protein P378_13800 [Desulforamulus profundi]
MPNLKNSMVPQELLVVGAVLKTGIFDVLQEKPCGLDWNPRSYRVKKLNSFPAISRRELQRSI